jgi:NADH-quinone oxidoreductase subunit G
MSDQPEKTDDLVEIEVDGVTVQARKGQMLIEVTDAMDVYVPRFCYHEKLSIAANCRMCLVEVDKAPKPLPACATPVAPGMKVRTRSPAAIAAQKATMEFLLINHPLDCPICDQGGECELQDLAMGYGRDVSRFVERKRSVKDQDLGPLVSTDMTRCIHCTRCVRFGQEIAGIQELGTIGRADEMEISTFIEHSVDHELSGNIIDLCPVGALNSKPFRYRARSWEMTQHETVSPHDCVGSNLYAHVRRGQLMRVVPRPNDEINETWIADRDRFSYEGVYSPDRLERPLAKRDGQWREVDWAEALESAAGILRSAGGKAGALAHPSATLEEHYLLGRILRGLGSNHIDHRLRRIDFGDQAGDPRMPGFGLTLAELETRDSILLIGSDLRAEAPMLAHRVRKAALAGARVAVLDTAQDPYLFPVVLELAGDGQLGAAVRALADGADGKVAEVLDGALRPAILLGQRAQRDPAFSRIRHAAGRVAATTGASLGFVTEGANAAGAALAGVLPHRGVGGVDVEDPGLDAARILAGDGLDACVVFGLEPEFDTAAGTAAPAGLARIAHVICVSPYATDTMREYADLILPIGTWAETAGTFVNGEGRWQSFGGVARPYGEARPGWKVLRVLGNLLGLDGFEYASAEDVRAELAPLIQSPPPDPAFSDAAPADAAAARAPDMYRVDPLVRRAPALARVAAGQDADDAPIGEVA